MGSRLTILVVYGSRHIAARIIHRLVRCPEVEIVGQACEAGEAISLISLREPRLVIADLSLSDGTGIDVLRKAKRMAIPPIVIMTSISSFPQERRECIKNDADHFFQLPDEIVHLEEVIRKLARSE